MATTGWIVHLTDNEEHQMFSEQCSLCNKLVEELIIGRVTGLQAHFKYDTAR